MKFNYPKIAEHLGVKLRGDETFTELLEIEKQVKERTKRGSLKRMQTFSELMPKLKE
jgi:hypothetical protein